MAEENKSKRERTYLDVPFKEKDVASALGAKFERSTKKWYLPGGKDVAPFARWMPNQDQRETQPSAAAPRLPDVSHNGSPEKMFGSDADFEREAVRLSELIGQTIEEAREFVHEGVRAAEENAALVARDYFLKQGSAFDAVDGIERAVRQARHQFFAERQHLYPQSTPAREVKQAQTQAPAQEATAKLDDVMLGRRYREMILSISASSTLHGDEVSRTLALDARLESIHRDAWRKSGNPVDGDRAVGEQIRTQTGFAAEDLPPRAAAALNKLRGEAELGPIAVDARTPAREVTASNPVDEAQPIDPVSVAPTHHHRQRDPNPDEGIATFADVAEAVEHDDAKRRPAPEDGSELEPVGPAAPSALSPEKNADWIKENAQSSKVIADRRGLTDRIESEFAQGKTAAQVTADLDKDLSFLPLMERETFVIYVRHALGIPSRATEEGKREFAEWQAEYDQRNAASPDRTADNTSEIAPDDQADVLPLPPAEPGTPQSSQDNGDDATFADVGEAAAIDDAMRRRGLSENAAPGTTPHVDASTVEVGAANEATAQPGKAANDESDTPVLDGSPGPSVRHQETPAQNEPDAKNPANEPARPVLDAVPEQELKRLKEVRARDRAAAEAALREQKKPMAKGSASADGEQAEGDGAGENHIGVDPASRKPIVKKDGYDVPPELASRYMVKEGRFWKLDGAQAKPDKSPTARPHIEDVGPRLKSQQNDRSTVADMLAIAEAKNWDAIVVRGDETFRRNAWILASLSGFDMKRFKGFKPKESDEALLEVAKREREALTIKAGKSPEPSADQKQDPTSNKPGGVEGKPETADASKSEPSQKPADGLSGELLEHGSARYQHKQDAAYSYFVRYRDDGGAERTVWGVDLKRAVEASGAKVGDAISLKDHGETAVTVEEPIYDAAGKQVGTQPKETQRNTWDVQRVVSAEPEPVSAKPDRVSLTVEQMREQLGKAVEKLPARQRTELLNRFDARMQAGTEIEARIARGEISRGAGAAAIDKRAAELHAAWTAPKAAPTSSPSNTPQTEQQQARGPMPNMM